MPRTDSLEGPHPSIAYGSSLWPFLILVGLLIGACGGALPQQPASAALHRDLERLVELSRAKGWSIDRTEVRDALPSALLSVCQTTPSTRATLLRWLDQQIEDLGGSAKQAYEAKNRDLGAIDNILSLSRIRMLLAQSMKVAEADCPFWLQEKPDFPGRQILDDRWLLSVGGGGKVILINKAGSSDASGGGAGRILAGRAFGRHATLLTGFEMGGSATFPRAQDGTRGNVSFAVDVVVPLIYRHRLVNSYVSSRHCPSTEPLTELR